MGSATIFMTVQITSYNEAQREAGKEINAPDPFSGNLPILIALALAMVVVVLEWLRPDR